MASARSVFRIFLLSVVVAALITVVPASRPGPGAQPAALAPHQQLLREIYQELIEINTTNSVGDNTKAAEAMARRLLDAGFPAGDVKVLTPVPRKGNLVARLRGTGARRPLLLLAHLDVVEANREDWSVDPFKLLERDGYFYGRGTSDDKGMGPAAEAITPDMVAASFYRSLGIDYTKEYHTSTGRPVMIVREGSPINGLFS